MARDRRRIVVISGAGSGIGAAAAEHFAQNGDHVVLLGRNRKALQLLAARTRRRGGSCETHQCDVRREARVKTVARKILRKHRAVDVLINNAGVTTFTSVLETSVKEFDDIVDTNLRGSYLLTRAFLPRFLRQRGGTILNVISHAAKQVYRGSGAYAASKAGVEALMNVLRAEVRESGVRVVNVFPGAVLTGIWHPRHRQAYADRMMRASDVAAVLYGLTVQPASMMTEEIVIRPQGGDLKV